MKIRTLCVSSALLLIVGFAGGSFAASGKGGFQSRPSASGGGFVGDSPAIITVKEAQTLSDDAFVTLRGKILQRVGKDNYLFQDGTGTIEVDIDADKWRGQDITPADTVEIQGEVDKDWNSVEIEVESIVKVQ